MILIVVAVIAVAVIGNMYFFKSKSTTEESTTGTVTDKGSSNDGNPAATSSAPSGSGSVSPKTSGTKTPPAPRLTTPRETAERYLTLYREKKYLDTYNFLCTEDKKSTALDYSKYLVDLFGQTYVVSDEIRSATEASISAEYYYAETYSDGKIKQKEIVLDKRDVVWCVHSADPSIAADFKYFENIKLDTRNIQTPYVAPYGDPSVAIKPQNDGLRLTALVTNSGGQTFLCHDSNTVLAGKCGSGEFVLQGPNGERVSPLWSSFPAFSIPLGGTVSGDLIFEIPHNTTGYTLVFTDRGYKRDIQKSALSW